MADLSVSATAAPDSQAGCSEVADDNLRLREQYAEIAQLAGGLAHEIRNPLSTMCLNLDLLAEDFQEPENPRERRHPHSRTQRVACGCVAGDEPVHVPLPRGRLTSALPRPTELPSPQFCFKRDSQAARPPGPRRPIPR